ncbi:Ice-structuring glycoprotein precursor (ISGP) (Antifreeze glycopeptide polyprotein) (AFGP polyprotein) [Contains: AFGP7 (AFGP 7); AFGP8 (AFGP 8); AFGP8-like] (Fragment) [hydrothermal vent metagenome]|uniref:Ice-structuring glycoprotein (ISGP) (Antifreeze glycopeptide polyprotein) (AFGP polyprotein) n=1 Tax=hydrothermal vent metagenome TaxID=652676 RepID=A0A3B0V9R0_9ZZZZ
MKRNNLTTAIVASIAGVAGIASVSNAVNLNPDGVGQVLVYPYYTVNNDLLTLISVVNTTDQAKAVKVRFLEGKNSRECLDFNLYLSPYDVWTAALASTVATAAFAGSYAGDNSVKLHTSDTSCTVPDINQYEFLPWGFDPQGDGDPGNGYDNGGRDLQRCTEGHFEMIEMGTLFDTGTNGGAASAVTHDASGVPADCGVVNNNWIGTWLGNPNDGLEPPTGGLFGSVSLVDVAGGTDVTYNADAIQGYTSNTQHTDPGDIIPSLATGARNTSYVFNGNVVQSDFWTESIQAVSALYIHNQVYGEYVLSDTIGANTEWVVTFPTKFAYVDPNIGYAFAPGTQPNEPFTTAFTSAGGGTACEEYGLGYWDREEQEPAPGTVIILPSPRPPGIIVDVPIFCWETNVLELHDNDDYDDSLPSEVLGSNLTTHFQVRKNNVPDFFDTGWIALTFGQSTDDNFSNTTYTGLPVTGFAIQRYVNGALADGILANYAGLFKHRYSKSISS